MCRLLRQIIKRRHSGPPLLLWTLDLYVYLTLPVVPPRIKTNVPGYLHHFPLPRIHDQLPQVNTLMAPGQVVQAPAALLNPIYTTHLHGLHPLVQHHKISPIINSIITHNKFIEHRPIAVAYLGDQYPSAHSSHHMHHPLVDHQNSICKIHENHRENRRLVGG